MRPSCFTVLSVVVFCAHGLPVGRSRPRCGKAERPRPAQSDCWTSPGSSNRITAFRSVPTEMRKNVQAAEDALKLRRKEYELLVERLEGLPKDSEKYRNAEGEVKRFASEINAKVAEQKQHFLKQEATIYIEVYDEIMLAVKRLAEQRGIKLVLRFNGDPVDRSDPQEVLKELNKSVMYHHETIDLTDAILAVSGLPGRVIPPAGNRGFHTAMRLSASRRGFRARPRGSRHPSRHRADFPTTTGRHRAAGTRARRPASAPRAESLPRGRDRPRQPFRRGRGFPGRSVASASHIRSGDHHAFCKNSRSKSATSHRPTPTFSRANARARSSSQTGISAGPA